MSNKHHGRDVILCVSTAAKQWLVRAGLLFLSLSFTGAVQAQRPATVDSAAAVATDTVPEKVPFFDFKSDYINPKKAAILSFALPGAGQAYNKRWWKLPLVYGAIGGMVYAIDFNQGLYRRFRDALKLQLADQPHEFTGTGIDSANALRSLRDEYDRNTQLSYIGSVLLYGVIAVEAFVDAHLIDFNIDDDLSLRVQPSIQPLPSELGLGSAGIAVVVQF